MIRDAIHNRISPRYGVAKIWPMGYCPYAAARVEAEQDERIRADRRFAAWQKKQEGK